MHILETSIEHNKYLILLFLEDNHPIPTKSPAQILSLNLAYKGVTHAYLEKTSMTHKKYLPFLFLEHIYLIPTKSSAHTLSLNLAQTFLILNFLLVFVII